MIAESELDGIPRIMNYSPRGNGFFCGWKKGVCVHHCEAKLAPTYQDVGYAVQPMACYIRNAQNGSGVCVSTSNCLPEGQTPTECIASCYDGKGCIGRRICQGNTPEIAPLPRPRTYENCVAECTQNEDGSCFSVCGIGSGECERTCQIFFK